MGLHLVSGSGAVGNTGRAGHSSEEPAAAGRRGAYRDFDCGDCGDRVRPQSGRYRFGDPCRAGVRRGWQGAADNGRETFDVALTINGEGAEQAATSSHTNRATGARCDRVERVVSASETELTLAAKSVTGTGCDKDAQSTIQLHTDGSIAYRTGAVGTTINGVLHKV